jgi:hypothetical protein
MLYLSLVLVKKHDLRIMIIYLALIGVSVAENFNCGIPPLVVPVTNNTLDDRVALNRGVPLTVGSQPAQPQGA